MVELKAPNGIRFKKQPDGLTRSIISELLKERDEKKALRNTFAFGSPQYVMYDMQQNVLKVIMNTYYGVSGYTRFRLFDREIGSAVTSVGRAIIEHTRRVIEQQGYKVIYGDTDSCMVQLPPLTRKRPLNWPGPLKNTSTKVTRSLQRRNSTRTLTFSPSSSRRSMPGFSRQGKRSGMPDPWSGRKAKQSVKPISWVLRSNGAIPRRSPKLCR